MPSKDKRVVELYRRFKEKYICEELTSEECNKTLIKTFSGGRYGKGVETFLKNAAWDASVDFLFSGYL